MSAEKRADSYSTHASVQHHSPDPRSGPRRGRALIRGLLLAAALVASAVSTSACGLLGEKNVPEVTGQPSIRFEPSLIEMGNMKQTAKRDGTVTIRNVGDQTLLIKDVTTH